MSRFLLVFLFLLFAHPAIAGSFEDGQAAVDGKDFVTASKIWEPLAEQGDVKAQAALGWLNGISSPYMGRNFDEAFKWNLKAAQQGNTEAQSAVAYLYMMGLGTTKSYTEAATWAHLAAEQGDRSAYGILGTIYQYGGNGAQQDMPEAYFWRKLALEGANSQYYTTALDLFNKAGATLTAEQADAANKRADEWLKKHPFGQDEQAKQASHMLSNQATNGKEALKKNAYKPEPKFDEALPLVWGTLIFSPIAGFGIFYLIRRRWPQAQRRVAKIAAIVFLLIVTFFKILHFSFTASLINIWGFVIGYSAFCFLGASCRLIPSASIKAVAQLLTLLPIICGYLLGTGGLLGLMFILGDYTSPPTETDQMEKNLSCEITGWGSAGSASGYTVHLYKTWDALPFLRREVENLNVIESGAVDGYEPQGTTCADALAAYNN